MVDPVHVGGHWDIVNVGWGGARIGVLVGSFTESTFTFPHFPLTAPEVISDAFNPIKIGSGAVSNPIDTGMLRRLKIWSDEPEKAGPDSDHVCTGKSIIFFNVNKLFNPLSGSFAVQVRTPAGGIETHSDTFYWLWGPTFIFSSLDDNLDHPYTTGDPIRGGIMTIPAAFETAAEAGAYIAFGGSFSTFAVESREESRTFNNELRWKFDFYLYRGKLNFPVADGHTATPPSNPWDLVGKETLLDNGGASAIQTALTLPAATLRWTVKKNNTVKFERS